MKYQKIGSLILRLSMAGVFLYFGFSQLLNAGMWVGVVPAWVTSFVAAHTVVLSNGTFEIVLATLLALGVWTRWVALILAIHLLVIASGFGFSPTGVRDLGLALATFSMFFLYHKAPHSAEHHA